MLIYTLTFKIPRYSHTIYDIYIQNTQKKKKWHAYLSVFFLQFNPIVSEEL